MNLQVGLRVAHGFIQSFGGEWLGFIGFLEFGIWGLRVIIIGCRMEREFIQSFGECNAAQLFAGPSEVPKYTP